MEYDDHQWALRPLLEGAFMAYMALSVTAFMKFGCRVAVYAGLWMWFWLDNNSADTGMKTTHDVSMSFAIITFLQKHTNMNKTLLTHLTPHQKHSHAKSSSA